MKKPGRRAVAATDKKGIRDRLRGGLEAVHGRPLDWTSRFYAEYGVEEKTARKWLAADPVTPDVAALLRIAARTGVSLDWLLLGSATAAPMQAKPPASAAQQLFDAVCKRLDAERTEKVGRRQRKNVRELHQQLVWRAEAALEVVHGMTPEDWWDEVVAAIPDSIGDYGMAVTDAYDARAKDIR